MSTNRVKQVKSVHSANYPASALVSKVLLSKVPTAGPGSKSTDAIWAAAKQQLRCGPRQLKGCRKCNSFMVLQALLKSWGRSPPLSARPCPATFFSYSEQKEFGEAWETTWNHRNQYLYAEDMVFSRPVGVLLFCQFIQALEPLWIPRTVILSGCELGASSPKISGSPTADALLLLQATPLGRRDALMTHCRPQLSGLPSWIQSRVLPAEPLEATGILKRWSRAVSWILGMQKNLFLMSLGSNTEKTEVWNTTCLQYPPVNYSQ